VDHVSKALEVGPNSLELRELRLRCVTELGDIAAIYGDLSRLSILNPSNLIIPIQLSQIAYFLIGSENALNHIKQCLHYDPDSKPCKKVHKVLRGLQKDTTKVRGLVEKSQWRQAIKIMDGPEGLLAKFESAFDDAMSSDGHLSERIPSGSKPLSQSRLDLYSLACKAAVGGNDFGKRTAKWADIVLTMDPENADALIALGERQLKDESWDEAVRTLSRAFEATGQSSQDVSSHSGDEAGHTDVPGSESPESRQEVAKGLEAERLLQSPERTTGRGRSDY
jgi:DnaJ family protein C protein 3